MPFVQSCGLQLRISQASASSYAAGYSGLRQPQQQAAVKHHGSLSMAPLMAPAVEAAFRVTTIRCADAGTHCLHLCSGWLPCLAAGFGAVGARIGVGGSCTGAGTHRCTLAPLGQPADQSGKTCRCISDGGPPRSCASAPICSLPNFVPFLQWRPPRPPRRRPPPAPRRQLPR